MKQNRLKILFVLIMIISVNSQGFAVTPAQNLALIENHIFGYESANLSEQERLNNIEKFVYGATQNNSVQDRLANLNSDLGVDVNSNSSTTYAGESDGHNYQDYANEPTDSTAQYPVVDNIEEAILQQTYKTENIYKRLDRLEKKVYGKVSTGSLSERVEKLSTLVSPITPKQQSYDDYMANNDEYNYFSPATNGNPMSMSGSNYIPETLPSAAKSEVLLSLEQNILGKTYTADSTSRRLSRLEKRMLNKDFASEPDEFRIERLATVANAQQSSQTFGESKLMQHLSTGIQIGGMILMFLAMIL